MDGSKTQGSIMYNMYIHIINFLATVESFYYTMDGINVLET